MSSNYVSLTKQFEQIEKLYHYTTFETLKIILENKTFRLSAINETLNDPFEMEYLDYVWQGKVFVVCFTTSNRNEYFWKNYAYRNDSRNNQGVCIGINKKNINRFEDYKVMDSNKKLFANYVGSNLSYNSYDKNEDWAIKQCIGGKVIYKDNPCDDFSFDEELANFFDGIFDKSLFQRVNDSGFVKAKTYSINGIQHRWDVEDEYRIRVVVHSKGLSFSNGKYHKPPFKYIYLDISNWIENITIYVRRRFSLINELDELSQKYGFKYEVIE